jgi:hypothetical protein
VDELGRETTGRVQTLGRLAAPDMWLDAADVYLDSFPFSSLTAVLEAAIRGIPVLAYQPADRCKTVLAADSPGLEPLLRGRTGEEYQLHLETLVRDAAARERVGQDLQEGVRTTHIGDCWRRDVGVVFSTLAERTGARVRATPTAVEALGDLDELLANIGGDVRDAMTALGSWYAFRWPRWSLSIPVLSANPPTTTWGPATIADTVDGLTTGAGKVPSMLLAESETRPGARATRAITEWLKRRSLRFRNRS